MEISIDGLNKVAQADDTPVEWRIFKLNDKEKCRFKIRGIKHKPYRIAQERITESLRMDCGNITHIDSMEQTTFGKHLTAIAYHLVEDWEGIVDKKTQIDVPFTHKNLADLLIYSGELGVALQAWIIEQSTNIQMAFDSEVDRKVGKLWSFTDSMQNNSDQKNSGESENDLENHQ
jgi:hypothetical protein